MLRAEWQTDVRGTWSQCSQMPLTLARYPLNFLRSSSPASLHPRARARARVNAVSHHWKGGGKREREGASPRHDFGTSFGLLGLAAEISAGTQPQGWPVLIHCVSGALPITHILPREAHECDTQGTGAHLLSVS